MADYSYINSTGLIVPDTSETREDVEQAWRNAFGNDFITSPETPQGVFITQQAHMRDMVLRINAELANQINPDFAKSVFLESIGSLTGIDKFRATRSIAAGVIVAGVAGTIIPQGSVIEEPATRIQFRSRVGVQIPAGGSIAVEFESVEFGAIQMQAGKLTRIVTGTLGWETATNPTDAVVGRLEESDASFRRRRRQTLQYNNSSTSEAITSALYAIDGVLSVKFLENVTNSSQTIEGISLVAHSIWVSVHHLPIATRQEIADAILREKSAGANWNGSITQNSTDPISGQVYAVKFDEPTEIPVYVRVTVRSTDLDATDIVKDAIMAYAAGEIDGENPLGVGEPVSPFELAGAVNIVEPRINISKLELSTDGSTYSSNEVAITAQQVATISRSNINVIL